MKRLVLEAWLLTLYIEIVMRFRGFEALSAIVRNEGIRPVQISHASAYLCHAANLACALYFKRVMCLQRSAAMTLLLRRHGWHANLVIGVQIIPFKSHAWVEIEGSVINDKPYIPEIYQALERC